MVARAIGEGRQGQIQLADFNREMREAGLEKELSQEEYEQLSSPRHNLSQRTHLGAPAPKAVRANTRAQQSRVKDHFTWLQDRYKDLKTALDKVQKVREEIG